jgi:multidrug transporter EmrE-like cation transporter
MQILYLIIAFIFNSMGSVMFKVAANRGGFVLHGSLFSILSNNYLFILGCFFFALNAVFFVLALRTLPLSIANPIMLIMSFIIVGVVSISVLHERLDSMQLIGYVILILGVVIIFYFQK